MSDVVVIGAGPRGVGWLERFVENHAVAEAPDVVVHLIDPFPPGPGKIWRHDQSPLLKLNSLAEDVTMFTDETSVIDGPVVGGPSLAEWAEGIREGRITDVVASDEALAGELRTLGAKSFPTRRLQSLYLDWFHRRTLGRLPAGMTVVSHTGRAVDVVDLADDRQRVVLDSGEEVIGDVVVYALGHSGSDPRSEQAALVSFASLHGLFYLPPSFTSEADLAAVGAGETVVVRGFGLAAVDLIVLLGEGRGGRFERDGSLLRYVASGREPHLVIGSGRGVPYHSKITSTLVGTRPEPRYFSASIAASIAAAHPRLDFRAHVWPAIAKELLHGYYAELFTGHPDRVRVPWSEFASRFESVDPFGTDLLALAVETVIDPSDRLDLDRFDRPLAGIQGLSSRDLQGVVRTYIRDDLARRTQPEHSATQGLFLSLLGSYVAFFTIADSPNWTALSRERDLGGGWQRSFSYVASGPPGHRLEEIIALSEAGVITFAGAGLRVEADEDAGVFRARGSNSEESFVASALIDAWLPDERASFSDNPALRALVGVGISGGGGGVERVYFDGSSVTNTGKVAVARGDASVTLADGRPHPRRFAIGPYTSAPFVGAFARPRTNALPFRENDAVARAVLSSLSLARDEIPELSIEDFAVRPEVGAGGESRHLA